MRRLIWTALAVSLTAQPSLASTPTERCEARSVEHFADPIDLYQNDQLTFDIRRKGDVIGSHEVTFTRDGTLVRVHAKTQININLFFVPVFTYDYRSLETWCGDTLLDVKTIVRENGREKKTEAGQVGFTTNHWNYAAVKGDKLFNTVTGRHNEIRAQVTDEMIAVGASLVPARRYDISGGITYRAWYDDQGRWLQLSFKDKSGEDVILNCTSCDFAYRQMSDRS
ncbi:MAG: hypothetical protein EP347_07155 [Alphaproteobacteria bacterium]|nr:MAG: hypothetical protein EP347_07155 [Alphaproteobacteria bacterium]